MLRTPVPLALITSTQLYEGRDFFEALQTSKVCAGNKCPGGVVSVLYYANTTFTDCRKLVMNTDKTLSPAKHQSRWLIM